MMERLKTVTRAATRTALALVVLIVLTAATRAQTGQLNITQLDKLNGVAEQTIEVTLDKKLLQLAAKFLSDKNPDEAKVKELVNGLEGVYVRVFQFNKPGEYSPGELDTLRSQLQGWSKIVGVRSRKEGENVDVHLRYQGDRILGLAIIAVDPRTLTVVNIVGPIDLERLSQLEGQFGIPKLNLERTKKK